MSATKLSPPQVQLLSTSIYRYFYAQDEPPADEIFVPKDAIKEDYEGGGYLNAVVRFVSHWCGRKVHSIKIKFLPDSSGKINAKTIEYIV